MLPPSLHHTPAPHSGVPPSVVQLVSKAGKRHSHQDLCVAKLLCACTQAALERGADRREVQRRVRARLRWVRALAGVQRRLLRRSHELRATLWRTMLGLQTASGQAAAMLLEVRHSTRATTHSACSPPGGVPPPPCTVLYPLLPLSPLRRSIRFSRRASRRSRWPASPRRCAPCCAAAGCTRPLWVVPPPSLIPLPRPSQCFTPSSVRCAPCCAAGCTPSARPSTASRSAARARGRASTRRRRSRRSGCRATSTCPASTRTASACTARAAAPGCSRSA